MASSLFIVLDGPDGSGTTTHAKLLADRLQKEGREVLVTAEPSTGPIGAWIRKQLSSATPPPPAALQLLFCADRAWHVESVIKPALDEGKIVVCDRYIPSTIIYGEAQGIDSEWLRNINATFPQPDCTIFTLPALDTSMQRIHERDEKEFFEEQGMQKKIHAGYTAYAKAHASVRLIDTAGSKEESAAKIWSVIQALIA